MPSSARTCLICFILHLALGLGFIVWGAAVAPSLPHFQLDVVLTPKELEDRIKREETLAMLNKAHTGDGRDWIAGGLLTAVIGVIGLRAAFRLDRQGLQRSRSPNLPPWFGADQK
jgi:hypothetical protein